MENTPRLLSKMHRGLEENNPNKTLGLVVSFKNLKPLLVLKHFLTLKSSKDTNSGIHQNACHLRCLLTPVALSLSSAVNNLSNQF